MIKFIRESDIPEFVGKTWREKILLRSLAIKNSKSIYWINIIFGACAGLSIALSVFTAEYLSLKYLHRNLNFFPFIILLLVVGIPISYLFGCIILNPRMKKYFENQKGNPN